MIYAITIFFLIGFINVYKTSGLFHFKVVLRLLFNTVMWPLELIRLHPYVFDVTVVKISDANARIALLDGKVLGLFFKGEDATEEQFDKEISVRVPELVEMYFNHVIKAKYQ